ncbi:MAG: tRNA preQ1(34) S-adenosylmethionine ribosyltransferase-isomerase QueA [Clostridiales Family XIII bacterium]|jgi:S-adenosylmethionine:tRNA ribosyltransferase-isomerase|nr:tRNA preQ1(34) S-adenosylmethionine ribosyltransferase-isomerase QueA [Clostridiales Family XIII bacterium]
MRLSEFDYRLPAESIARYPAKRRDDSRLMVIHRDTGRTEHRRFYDVLSYLNAGDCLVINESKVLPARLFGVRERAGARGDVVSVECLLVRCISDSVWEIMVRPGKRLRKGDTVRFTENGDFSAEITDFTGDGLRAAVFRCTGDFMDRLSELGKMPIPPYIGREAEESDKTRYQTVYSRVRGSVAAPTAGLHFTDELLREAADAGVRVARLCLHVGPGTFRPVKTDDIETHTMHIEEYEISAECAALIDETKAENGSVICVGTTSARAVESAALYDKAAGRARARPGRGSTDIFIYPGYEFRLTDALITNFHLPKSTLLMLVSAFCDRERVLRAYEEAALEGYRFLTYGDAMLIL